MPYMNGVEMILHIRSRFPTVRVLMLTMAEDAPHIREALQAGAAGYILKSAGRDELEKALAAIAAGQPHISDSMLQELKHAQATHVWLDLQLKANILQLTYRDNGLGLDPTRLNQPTGNGLVNIRQQITLLNGNCVFASEAGQGTTVTISVPFA